MFEKVLIIAPHTDDGELGCGGTIAKFTEQRKEIFYIAFSTCKNEIPEEYDENILEKECIKATKSLGIPRKNLFIFDIENKNFPSQRKDIFEILEKLRKDINPDIAFTPSTHDTHQDHQTTTNEAIRAFRRNATLFAYEEPWNNIVIKTNAFIPLEKRHIVKKIKALKCYDSQSFQKRGYINEEYIDALAKTRGIQISTSYAEAFEVIRWVLTF